MSKDSNENKIKDVNKPKKKKGLVIINIILLLIIILIGLGIYIAIDNDIITINKDKTKNIKIIKNIEKEEQEEIITDSNLIVDLKNKVKYLSANNIHMMHIIPNLYKEEKITYIGEQEKLYIVLESLSNDYTSITNPKILIEQSLGSLYTDSIINDNKQISIDKVKKRYKELFGYDIATFNHIEGCPSYLYDSVNDVYYETTKCTKGEGLDREYTYDIKYTKEDNFAYVYLSIGTAFVTNPINDKETTEEKLNIYKGYSNAIYKEEVSVEDAENFIINDNNYNEFTIYKYKFFKDSSNNYYFISIEKTS